MFNKKNKQPEQELPQDEISKDGLQSIREELNKVLADTSYVEEWFQIQMFESKNNHSQQEDIRDVYSEQMQMLEEKREGLLTRIDHVTSSLGRLALDTDHE